MERVVMRPDGRLVLMGLENKPRAVDSGRRIIVWPKYRTMVSPSLVAPNPLISSILSISGSLACDLLQEISNLALTTNYKFDYDS
jgi:hypothetical protein